MEKKLNLPKIKLRSNDTVQNESKTDELNTGFIQNYTIEKIQANEKNKNQKKVKLSLEKMKLIKDFHYGNIFNLYLVNFEGFDKNFVMKVLHNYHHRIIQRNFEYEFKKWHYCQHENIVRIYAVFKHEETIKYISQYMDSGNLYEILKKAKVIPEKVLSAISFHILSGLLYLQNLQNMVYVSLDPGKILFNSKGNVRLMEDLLLGRNVLNNNAFYFRYISPERLNATNYSFNTAVWSLGVIILECATGSYPFTWVDGTPITDPWILMEVLKNVKIFYPYTFSQEFVDFLSLCLVVERKERYSIKEMLDHPFILKYSGYSKEIIKDFLKNIKK